jgi:hypothetical protein
MVAALSEALQVLQVLQGLLAAAESKDGAVLVLLAHPARVAAAPMSVLCIFRRHVAHGRTHGELCNHRRPVVPGCIPPT